MANVMVSTGNVDVLRTQLRGIFYDRLVNGIRLSNKPSFIASNPLHEITILSQP